jgi:hypothetical protein
MSSVSILRAFLPPEFLNAVERIGWRELIRFKREAVAAGFAHRVEAVTPDELAFAAQDTPEAALEDERIARAHCTQIGLSYDEEVAAPVAEMLEHFRAVAAAPSPSGAKH